MFTMSRDDMIREILELREKCKNNQKFLKSQTKQIHEAKEELSRLTTTNGEQIKQLEQLKIGADDKRNVLQKEHAALAAEVHSMQHQNDEEIDKQKSVLLTRQIYLKKCQEDINLAKQEAVPDKPCNSTSGIQVLLDVQNQRDNLKDEAAKQVVDNEVLLSKFKAAQESHKILDEKCEHNKTHMQEASSLKELLECDLMALKAEFHGLDVPEVDNRPKSLFDEVNDGREVLQTNVVKLNDNYIDMSKKQSSLMQQLNSLQQEKKHLKHKCEENRRDSHFDKFLIQCTYKDFVAVLPGLDEELKTLIKEREYLHNNVSKGERSVQFFQVIDKINRKIKDLDPKIIKESCENSNLQFKITKKEKELGSLQEKVKEMHTINEGLKTDIELVDCQEVNDKLICICSVQKK